MIDPPCRVTVLRGGPDAERDVSLRSGEQVVRALGDLPGVTVVDRVIDRPDQSALEGLLAEDRCDVVFPVLHGRWGEGGPLQHLLERIDRPFVGCRETAARRAMDKLETKRVATDLGIPTPRARAVERADDLPEPPFVLKPVDDGSSVGVRFVHDADERRTALEELGAVHDRLMAEALVEGRELTVGVVGETVLPPIEIVPAEGYYDFEAKYQRNDTEYRVDPPLPAGMAAQLESWTRRLHDALGVEDLSRTDWLLEETADGAPRAWLLEINTMPGLTEQSLLPKAAARHGWTMTELCGKLVERARRRHRDSRS